MNNPAEFNKKLQQARRALEIQNDTEALALYAALARKFPQSGVWAEYGHAAALAGDFELAEQIWRRMLARDPRSVELVAGIAGEYQNIRLHARARALFQQAAALAPRDLDAQLSLAWLLARTNSIDEARRVVGECKAIDPKNEQVRYLSAHLDRREKKLAEAESQFRDLIAAGPCHPYVAYACHAELAHILDRTGRFEEAMTQLAAGKRLARSTFGEEARRKKTSLWYKEMLGKTKALPKTILDDWSGEVPARARASMPQLSFLSGSARSGTTLLERILDAHPRVAACDEPVAFEKILPRIDFTAVSIPRQRLDVFRQRYLKNFITALGSSAGGKILLDKNPSQTAWLPAFLRVWPGLRVIIALRDPRDVMISLYFQNQGKTNGLTFEQLAEYYANVMDLWLAIRDWKGLAWIETRYEETVADLHKEGSRVTKFLGLDWHEDQGRFYEANREKPVMSTNYTDVTQPVYTRSVGRWRVYERYLAPVFPALEPYCKAFGYT